MNYETTKVRILPVLINKNDIFFKIHGKHHFLFHISAKQNLKQSGIKHVSYHKQRPIFYISKVFYA